MPASKHAVPPGHMEAMETVWTHTFKGLVGRHPDLFYWKTCIFSPAVLRAFGVTVYRAVHEAGIYGVPRESVPSPLYPQPPP